MAINRILHCTCDAALFLELELEEAPLSNVPAPATEGALAEEGERFGSSSAAGVAVEGVVEPHPLVFTQTVGKGMPSLNRLWCSA